MIPITPAIIPVVDPFRIQGACAPGYDAGPGYEVTGTRVRGRVTFRLAVSRGYCHGVERALRLARETLRSYPGQRIFLTSPILHNPRIHAELHAEGIRFLSESPGLWNELTARDVVLLPAFGVPPQVLEKLRSTGCVVVDTTCGSVVYVWKSVERFARDGFTVVYHGRRGHEEAAATLSRLDRVSPSCDGRPRPYLILESLVEAHAILRLFLEPGGYRYGNELPVGSVSAGFEPTRDLVHIGFASQTTMLARETVEIEEALRDAQARRFGEERLSEHFRVQDTICGATQERQDAVEALLDEPLDLVLVVGGHTSSNSAHLAELASKRLSTFHVEGPEDVLSADLLRHKVPGRPNATFSRGWLPPGHVVLGVTSGASTPEISVEAVIDRVSAVA